MKKKHKRVIVQYYAILLTFGPNSVIHQVLQTGATGHQFFLETGDKMRSQDENSATVQRRKKRYRSLNCPVSFKGFQL
jgi:hypothetical protein